MGFPLIPRVLLVKKLLKPARFHCRSFKPNQIFKVGGSRPARRHTLLLAQKSMQKRAFFLSEQGALLLSSTEGLIHCGPRVLLLHRCINNQFVGAGPCACPGRPRGAAPTTKIRIFNHRNNKVKAVPGSQGKQSFLFAVENRKAAAIALRSLTTSTGSSNRGPQSIRPSVSPRSRFASNRQCLLGAATSLVRPEKKAFFAYFLWPPGQKVSRLAGRNPPTLICWRDETRRL